MRTFACGSEHHHYEESFRSSLLTQRALSEHIKSPTHRSRKTWGLAFLSVYFFAPSKTVFNAMMPCFGSPPFRALSNSHSNNLSHSLSAAPSPVPSCHQSRANQSPRNHPDQAALHSQHYADDDVDAQRFSCRAELLLLLSRSLFMIPSPRVDVGQRF